MTRHPPGNWRARPTRSIITDPPSKCFINFDDLLGLVSERLVRCGALRNSAAMGFRGLDHRTATYADGVPRRNSAIIAGYGIATSAAFNAPS